MKLLKKCQTFFKNDIKENNIKVTTKLILSHIYSGDSLAKDNVNNNGMVLSLDGSIYYTYEVGRFICKRYCYSRRTIYFLIILE